MGSTERVSVKFCTAYPARKVPVVALNSAYTLKRTATSLAIEAISVPFIPSRWVGKGNMVKNILNAEKKQWTKAAFELGEGFFGEGAEEVLDKMKNDYFDSQMEKAEYQKQLDIYQQKKSANK